MADPDYFTLSEFRYLPSMDDEAKYSDDEVLRAAAYITSVIEREVGTSFVPREVTTTLNGNGADLVLPHAYVLEVTTASASGSPVDVSGISTSAGVVRYISGAGWPRGIANVSITYTTGYSATPPADIKEAAMQATRARLLEKHGSARVQDRTQTVSNDGGGTTTFVLAGPNRPTGYPDVDAVIIGWRDKLSGFGFA